MTQGLADAVLGKKVLDDELLEELETRLLMADVGVVATQQIIDDLTARLARKQLNDVDVLYNALREDMVSILKPCEQPLQIKQKPFVMLVVGVNGVGKTTSIGKIARRFKQQGFSVMLAAGDTFRAAAIEQLQAWGEQNEISVVAQTLGADSASVIYDAFQSVRVKQIDVLLADTAGRLHTQSNRMDELKKVKRVIAKLDDSAPHEIMLVLDAGAGQNALSQAQQFHRVLGVTGLAVTKLDGTAKGGILFAIAKQLAIPIRYIGIGESLDDLRDFNAEDFVRALISDVD